MKDLRFRQIHLDFHTSPYISGVGEKFDKKVWQERLLEANVDSITCFSLCHHGMSYHPTKVGKMHPSLKFDLLRAQMDACKEIGVKVQIYLSAGLNEYAAVTHPEWREVTADGQLYGGIFSANYHKLCFNTAYLDHLCRLTEEAVTLFPDADGVFYDIICQLNCCCSKCIGDMLNAGLDPENPDDRKTFSRQVLLNYYERTTNACRINDPSMPVFHNSGNIKMGDREILKYFSHLELESLPTGGWGYDHYPMMAAYSRNLDMDFLGMTGKFHTTWGEFGGFKHPNALRYECCAMLANNSKCSIGDQLHPSGELDISTYRMIGKVYGEIAEKESFCRHAESKANIAILSALSTTPERSERLSDGDIGAARMLLESQLFFDMIDTEMDFSAYKMIILPDGAKISEQLESKLLDFCQHGGKLVIAGNGIFDKDGKTPLLPGVISCGQDEFTPNYIKAAPEFSPDYLETPFVSYVPSEKISIQNGVSLGDVHEPFFNRSYHHFSSHQHTPYDLKASSWVSGVLQENVLYFAHGVFSWYRGWGAVAVKEYVIKAINKLLSDDRQIISDLPSTARATLMHQKKENRTILHLLYANTVLRGGNMNFSGGNIKSKGAVEVIEDLNTLHDISLNVLLDKKPVKVVSEPDGREIKFNYVGNRATFTLDKLNCHSMIVFYF